MAPGSAEVVPAWALPAEEVLKGHGVALEAGLSSGEVEARRAKFGWNELQKAPGTPLWKLILEQFNDTLVKASGRGGAGGEVMVAPPPPTELGAEP